jgi:hypothetical protein
MKKDSYLYINNHNLSNIPFSEIYHSSDTDIHLSEIIEPPSLGSTGTDYNHNVNKITSRFSK